MEQIRLLVDQMRFINLILDQQISLTNSKAEVLLVLASYNINSQVLNITKFDDISILGLYRIQQKINNLNRIIINQFQSKPIINDTRELA